MPRYTRRQLAVLLLLVAAAMLNPLCLALAPVALVFLVGYSYTKYFTWASHWILGLTDGMAAVGGWIAVTGRVEPPALVLWFALTAWIAGFDLLYACQDVDFDRAHGLHSVPARFGVAAALRWARVHHALTALALADILTEVGLPEGTLSVLPGPGSSVAGALISDPRVAKISFTGSTEVGTQVMRAAAENIARVSLELGGKSANIVFADADLDTCVESSVWSVFDNAGQDCCARSRAFIQRPIYEEFVERFAERTASIAVGDPLDESTEMGPLISEGQRRTSLEYIEIGLQEGARKVTGGDVPEGPGFFLRPTVLADVDNRWRVAQEEIFGPVACMIPFDSEEEVVRLANDTVYGLSGSIWTQNLGRAIRVAKAIRTGVLSVNSSSSVHTEAPFGGYKRSGIGREMGMHAVNLYTEVKNVYFSEV